MPEVNYYLKKAEGKPPRHLVYMQMRYHGQKFVYSMKFNVAKNNWDPKKQIVKARSETTADGSVNLNELLKNMKELCLKTYNDELANGIPSRETLKTALDAFMYRNVRKSKTSSQYSFFELIDKFIDGKMGEPTLGTIKTYLTAKMHLLNFQKELKKSITYDSINLEFRNAFVKYLGTEKTVFKPKGKGKGLVKVKLPGLSPNSVAKEIKNVKTFLNMALELKLTKNDSHKSKKFGVGIEETHAVYLTDTELRSLFEYDLSDDKRLEAVRDLFIWQSYVGLRYSDAIRIKPENIIKKANGRFRIKITTQKTGDPVEIPCNDIVLRIFDKYKHNENRLPPAISNQKFNQYLKEACKKAGLKETGRLASDLTKPLYECLSSHTSRRNFATNCYLAGMDSRIIRAITGHATEKSFEAYIRVTRSESADKMEEHMENALSKRSLKAV